MIALTRDAAETAAELWAAFERRRSPGWPDTLRETLMHPTYARLLLIELQHPVKDAPPVAREPVVRPDPPPVHDRVSSPQRNPVSSRVTTGDLDRKRLAAGEKPDD